MLDEELATDVQYAAYKKRRDDLTTEQKAIADAREKVLSDLPTVEAAKQKAALQSLEALDERAKTVAKSASENHLAVSTTSYKLLLGGRLLEGTEGGRLTVELKPVVSEVKCGFWSGLFGTCKEQTTTTGSAT